MFAPSGEYSESRPFKIFISLLDKWEIASPLTDALVLDALKAIRFLMQRDGEERNEDVRHAFRCFEYMGLIYVSKDFHDRQYTI
jgi:hypothetical protein